MEEVNLTENEIRDGAPFAALAYVLFLWIFVFIFRKDNRFAHFHAKQGIALFIVELASMFLPLLPWFGEVLARLGLICCVIASLYGIYAALTGKMVRIPGIGGIAERLVV